MDAKTLKHVGTSAETKLARRAESSDGDDARLRTHALAALAVWTAQQ